MIFVHIKQIDSPNPLRSASASLVKAKRSAALTWAARYATLFPSSPTRISGRLFARLLFFALLFTAELNHLSTNSGINGWVAQSSLLEEIALSPRDLVFEVPPSDVVDHDLEDLVEAAVRIAIREVECDHLIRVDELVADVAVEVADNLGLFWLDLEILDGAVDVNRLLDVASLDGDLENLVCLRLVDFLKDDFEAFEGGASEIHAVDDVWFEDGDLIADQGAVSLDAIAVVDADEVHCTAVVAIVHLDGRHYFLVRRVPDLLMYVVVNCLWVAFDEGLVGRMQSRQ